MSESDFAAEARQWLRYAGEDLRAAVVISHDSEAAPRHACFLAQQAAEKGLKAALVLEQIEFPKSHDLDVLRNLLPSRWRVTAEHPDLNRLGAWAVEARYPGDWAEATPEDAAAAVELAQAVLDLLQADFRSGAHGWPVT